MFNFCFFSLNKLSSEIVNEKQRNAFLCKTVSIYFELLWKNVFDFLLNDKKLVESLQVGKWFRVLNPGQWFLGRSTYLEITLSDLQ